MAAGGDVASGKGRPKEEAERIIGAMLQGRFLALDFGFTAYAVTSYLKAGPNAAALQQVPLSPLKLSVQVCCIQGMFKALHPWDQPMQLLSATSLSVCTGAGAAGAQHSCAAAEAGWGRGLRLSSH